MHWKDIVVKHYTDVEYQIRMGPYRTNFAMATKLNNTYCVRMGEPGSDMHIDAWRFEEYLNTKYITTRSIFSFDLNSMSGNVANATNLVFTGDSRFVFVSNSNFEFVAGTLMLADDSFELNSRNNNVIVRNLNSSNAVVGTLTLSSLDGFSYNSINKFKVTTGNDIIFNGDTKFKVNTEDDITMDTKTSFDISGYQGGLAAKTSNGDVVGSIWLSHILSYDTENDTTVDAGGAIDIECSNYLHLNGPTVYSEASNLYRVNSQGNLNIERVYKGTDDIALGNITLDNYNGDITFNARPKINYNLTRGTIGGEMTISKYGFVNMQTDTSNTNRIIVSNAEYSDSDIKSARPAGIELYAKDKTIDLVIKRNADNVKSRYVSLFDSSGTSRLDSRVDIMDLQTASGFNIQTTNVNFPTTITTNASAKRLDIISDGINGINLETLHQIELDAAFVRFMSEAIILENPDSNQMWGTGNPTGNASTGRLYFKIIT